VKSLPTEALLITLILSFSARMPACPAMNKSIVSCQPVES
jgi:hypothetical protein